MDHVVYVNAKAKGMELLLNKQKTMVIRGAAGRKTPYGKVNVGDNLFFMNNNGEGLVKSKAVVTKVYDSHKMEREESIELVDSNQEFLKLSKQQIKKFAGKKYITLISIDQVVEVKPFSVDKSNFSKMDDWLCVGDIATVRANS